MGKLTILSGADISGSCYLYEQDGVRVLFDCGARINGPNNEHPEIPSPESIDAIFISHAHVDHMGSIAYAASVCKNAKIYMTEETKKFVLYQLEATIAEHLGARTDSKRFYNRILCDLIVQRIETVTPNDQDNKYTIFKSLNGTKCYFSLFHAGHIPGAVMVYLCIGTSGKTVLYTGDFSACQSTLTAPYYLDRRVKPNILILCGTRANNPYTSVISENVLHNVTRAMQRALSARRNLVIPVGQLTKGLEILAAIDDLISAGEFPRCRIYLEPHLWDLTRYYEQGHPTFRLPDYFKPLSELTADVQEPTIVFEHARYERNAYSSYVRFDLNFTLHADYVDLIDFIREREPEQVFLVHVADRGDCLCNDTGKMNDNLRRIIYTENGREYDII